MLRKTLHQMGIVNVRGHLSFIKRRGMKYSSIFPYEGIPGWLSEDEAITLFEIALSLPNDRPVAVEIGSWLGKSSLVLSKGMKGKTQPKLYCIDPFNGDADAVDRAMYGREMRKLNRTLEETFRDNMEIDPRFREQLEVVERDHRRMKTPGMFAQRLFGQRAALITFVPGG